ncbi:MAG: hypothetical protein ACRCW4_00445 [Candidatus Neomicrothrix subdominans]
MTELPPITLPAEHVIPAWRNASIGSGPDVSAVLDETILVEWYSDGLRFVATDRYVLMASYAATERDATSHQAPDHDLAPLGAVVAVVADRLMVDFLKHQAAMVKVYQRAIREGLPAEPAFVTFSVGTLDEPDSAQQRLDIGDTRSCLVVSSEAERIALPLVDGVEYPPWRSIMAGYTPAPRAKVAAKADVLRRIGQLDTYPYQEEQDWIQLTMGKGGLVLVTGVGRVPLEGAFTPRKDEPAEQGEAA